MSRASQSFEVVASDVRPAVINEHREAMRAPPHDPDNRRIASIERQLLNVGVTEILIIPSRGHALTIDGGWNYVASKALEFVRRFVPA